MERDAATAARTRRWTQVGESAGKGFQKQQERKRCLMKRRAALVRSAGRRLASHAQRKSLLKTRECYV
jgi:hypothetical protein